MFVRRHISSRRVMHVIQRGVNERYQNHAKMASESSKHHHKKKGKNGGFHSAFSGEEDDESSGRIGFDPRPHTVSNPTFTAQRPKLFTAKTLAHMKTSPHPFRPNILRPVHVTQRPELWPDNPRVSLGSHTSGTWPLLAANNLGSTRRSGSVGLLQLGLTVRFSGSASRLTRLGIQIIYSFLGFQPSWNHF